MLPRLPAAVGRLEVGKGGEGLGEGDVLRGVGSGGQLQGRVRGGQLWPRVQCGRVACHGYTITAAIIGVVFILLILLTTRDILWCT